ncbi:ABC transporter ATP-binding protein [Colwellia polaris]|jgi:ABC-2 type transport system ATP-binding protein|uniref:ABC transporter ATP-binding protein n=1 Tax=Colwellia polaris TaxID=326537 RepID=UPI000A1720F9|nr:ABC transporter ATP-binding protein [Colwellia polaris]|tara:strand:+ start:2439 stop:3338 length:900 start_codon:yes stop_codon:yes gene_type:complete
MSLIIDVQQVTKKYGNNTALNNVEFSLESGAPVALVGPNGAGKTTLFSLLCGYIQPTSGNINILGHSPGNSALFGRLSALPQDAQLDPRFSIAMQLNFYARLQGMSSKQAKIDTLRVLDMVGLQDATKSLPAELSHGMRKRATIAQALLGSPEIVMLDEATAGLDPANAKEIRAIVAEHADNVNFILSSHDLNELERLCDRVLYLESGHLKQHQTQDNNVNTRYITLRVKQAYQDLIPKLSIIPSVEKIEMTQDKEYLLTINSALSANNVEIDLLKILIKNNWLYSHIINGKTLENQLF